jgi:hypothetical protein
MARRAVNADGSTQGPQYAGYRSQAQSPRGELRGKKRIEDLGLGRFVHARTHILNFQPNITARRERLGSEVLADFLGCQVSIARSHLH